MKTTEQAQEESIDDDMVTLTITVQQIPTGLRTTESDEDRFPPIAIAVYGQVMRK
jgi:hypothetical protein